MLESRNIIWQVGLYHCMVLLALGFTQNAFFFWQMSDAGSVIRREKNLFELEVIFATPVKRCVFYVFQWRATLNEYTTSFKVAYIGKRI